MLLAFIFLDFSIVSSFTGYYYYLFCKNRYDIFILQVISHFLLFSFSFIYFFFSSSILSFPHKCGVRYNNVPVDVHAHYAEPLISISLQQLIPNHSGNNFRQARKLQTFCGMICGRPASNKIFKKWFAGAPQATKPLKSELWEARKRQNL